MELKTQFPQDAIHGKRSQHGLTLIELLIVIAIIGILASIALAYYRSQYVIKARLSEVINCMSTVASSVEAYYKDNNAFPSALSVALINDSLGVSLPVGAGIRFSAMSVDAGVITATVATNLDPVVDGKTIILRPTTDQYGVIYWAWTGTVPPVYLPKR
jgi:type IV pilus assembly protein PilA